LIASCFLGTDGCAHLPNARVPLSGWASFDLDQCANGDLLLGL
jgi:hypothetical protein